MTTSPARLRIDLWLYRVRLTKTRAAAARLVSEGGVRLVHNGVPRRLEKPSVEVSAGDVLMLPGGRLKLIAVEAIPSRRGPASEARTHYSERDAEGVA